MKNEFTEIRLNNPGVLYGKLPDDIFSKLKEDIKVFSEYKIPANSELVGQIEHQVKIELNNSIVSYLDDMWKTYSEMFNYYKGSKYSHTEPWINLQKKYEYNPVHLHTGIVSWVIWVNIPYTIENESKCKNTAYSTNHFNSKFQFIYNMLDGRMQTFTIPVDKQDEGNVIMFPAFLRHTVYPFYTSDELRVSVAGNIKES